MLRRAANGDGAFGEERTDVDGDDDVSESASGVGDPAGGDVDTT